MPQTWDEEYDVVVVGSGGAGLTAAILAHGTALQYHQVHPSEGNITGQRVQAGKAK